MGGGGGGSLGGRAGGGRQRRRADRRLRQTVTEGSGWRRWERGCTASWWCRSCGVRRWWYPCHWAWRRGAGSTTWGRKGDCGKGSRGRTEDTAGPPRSVSINRWSRLRPCQALSRSQVHRNRELPRPLCHGAERLADVRTTADATPCRRRTRIGAGRATEYKRKGQAKGHSYAGNEYYFWPCRTSLPDTRCVPGWHAHSLGLQITPPVVGVHLKPARSCI